MSEKRITVRFYRQPSGKEPVREWLLSLSRRDRLAIGTDIKTVEFGWPVGLPVCRPMGDGLWEVRSALDQRIARVLFCIADDSMWLLHGFIKKQPRTPPQDLALARRRMREIFDALKQERQ
ncbi:MAG: type II toxin-antitoxin system RelE/ParE family toxin [Phycisphaeraceae bacterium]|nr:type II toxin-antitoxin system RelE/ParE family toxin [Phycisphaeraceae bacterium]